MEQKQKYTLLIALVVLTILIAAFAYTGYSAYTNSPEAKAREMKIAQEELLAEIAKDQAQMAEEAKKLIGEMGRKKAEQEKIYQAYLSGAKMDQRELRKIQDKLKNLEYCEAMMSYECFTNGNANSGATSAVPGYRYSLITTAYAHDDNLPDDSMAHLPLDTRLQDDDNLIEKQQTRPKNLGDDTLHAPISAKRNGSTQQTIAMSKQYTHASLTTQGQETPEERTEGKIQGVLELGYREGPVRAIFASCKDKAKDPQHCLVVGLTLMHNESGDGQTSLACVTRNNCFGIASGRAKYKTLQGGMDAWVGKYNKYWYKAPSASFFYSPKGKLPPSRYCTSEHSSNSAVGCPNGLSIASAQWEKVEKIIK